MTPTPTTTTEIFAAGTHVAADGTEWVFTEADLAQIVAGYDVSRHEAPVVIGHPKSDAAPAYGWAKGLRVEGGKLLADLGQVDAAFAELVRAGRYKKISSSFWPPRAKTNPTPGKWALRHIGFLGAVPPAVKGLKEAHFADAAEALEFGGGVDAWILRPISRLLRGLRDFVVDQVGTERAAALLPDSELQQLDIEIGRAEERTLMPDPRPAFSGPNPQEDSMSAADREALERDRQKLAQERAEFTAARQKAMQAEDAALVQSLLGTKLPVGERDGVLAFMAQLVDADGVVEFGEGVTRTKISPHEYFRGLLGRLPNAVEFSEAAPDARDDHSTDFATPAGFHTDGVGLALHNRALHYQRKNGGDYLSAVRAAQQGSM